MLNLKKLNQTAKGNLIAGSNPDKGRTIGVVCTLDSKTDKEIDRLAKKEAKFKPVNELKIKNCAIEEERTVRSKKKKAEKKELDNLCKEAKAVVLKPKSKSQLETERIIEEGELIGYDLSVKDARIMKQERRIQAKIVYPVQAAHYFKTINERAGSKVAYIILMGLKVILIQAKCPMPENANDYLIDAKAILKAQVDNIAGYFLPSFGGIGVMTTDIGLLATALQNFKDDDGTGSTVMIEAAVKEVQLSIAALVVYVNKICRGNQLDALIIISEARMEVVKAKPKGETADFRIKQGTATGEIILISKAGMIDKKRVPTTYYWQYGLMVGTEMIWYDLPDTVGVCKTTATGMPIDVVVAFRKATKTTKGGLSTWCTPITISPK